MYPMRWTREIGKMQNINKISYVFDLAVVKNIVHCVYKIVAIINVSYYITCIIGKSVIISMYFMRAGG